MSSSVNNIPNHSGFTSNGIDIQIKQKETAYINIIYELKKVEEQKLFPLQNNNAAIGSRFVDFRPEINRQNKEGNTPLHLAVKVGNESTAQSLLPFSKIEIKNNKGNTALHIASKKGSAGIVSMLLAYGANMDTLNNQGFKPLDLAIRGLHKNSIEKESIQKEKEANFLPEDIKKMTPLTPEECTNLMESLLRERGKKISYNKFIDYLKKIAGMGCVKSDKDYYDREMCQNESDCKELGWKLSFACLKELCTNFEKNPESNNNNNEIVGLFFQCLKIFVEKGFDPNAKLYSKEKIKKGAMNDEKYYQTPLHFSAKFGATPLCLALLRMGVKVDTPLNEIHTKTALHFAIENDDIKTAKALLENGANPNAVTMLNKGYFTPLMLVKKNTDLIDLLIDFGANVNYSCKENGSCYDALYIAAVSGYPNNLKRLMNKCEDFTNENRDYITKSVLEEISRTKNSRSLSNLICNSLLGLDSGIGIVESLLCLHNREFYESKPISDHAKFSCLKEFFSKIYPSVSIMLENKESWEEQINLIHKQYHIFFKK